MSDTAKKKNKPGPKMWRDVAKNDESQKKITGLFKPAPIKKIPQPKATTDSDDSDCVQVLLDENHNVSGSEAKNPRYVFSDFFPPELNQNEPT